MQILMKTLIITLFLAVFCHAGGRVLSTDPVRLDTSFPLHQVEAFIDHFAIPVLKDSGVVVDSVTMRKKLIAGKYGERALRIYNDIQLESLESFFTLLYATEKFKTKRDCGQRWVAIKWFHDTGISLGIPIEDLRESEESMTNFMLKLCEAIYRGEPLGEPVKP